MHAERVVTRCAVDDPAQEVEAALAAAALRTFAPAASHKFGCRLLKPLVSDKRLMPAFRLDPLFLAAPRHGTFAHLGAPEVEPVPIEATGVDGVFEDGPDRRLRPFAGAVAAAVDVARGGGGPPGRFRWLAISLKPQPPR
jgi:hypothetical protein